MGRLFGTNGVRGIVNQDFTIEKASLLAASAASILGGKIAVGRDGRTSSPMFRDAVVSALTSVGCRVIDLGVLPTPALQYAVKHLGLDGGLMVTASHNPPEFNGVKVMAADGVEVPRGVEAEIEDVYFKGGPELVAWDEIGCVVEKDALDVYIEAVSSHVDVDAIRKAGLKIALDPGNGVASHVAPILAQKLGCGVFTINAEVDGRFPGRGSEPTPDNLDGLRELVLASGADLGLAFDGDGDRALFVDEEGEVYWGDRSFALVAREFMRMNPGSTVATPVSSSTVIEDVVEAGGGRVHWTRVGSVDVSRAMVEHGLLFGGEENGGIMYGPHHPVRDASMAMALHLDIMAKTGRRLSTLFSELPRYAQQKDRVHCPDEKKQLVLEELQAKVEAPRVETIDGVKLYYPDDSWILVRPSGTEPIFRLYAEAGTPDRAQELVDIHRKLVEELVSG